VRSRAQVVTWIRAWVPAMAVVACDPMMRDVLGAHGVRLAGPWSIGTTAPDPLSPDVARVTPAIGGEVGTMAADPLMADGVMATPIIRAARATAVISSEFSGGLAADVRAVQG
jgi:hypothetical protein